MTDPDLVWRVRQLLDIRRRCDELLEETLDEMYPRGLALVQGEGCGRSRRKRPKLTVV